VVARLDANLAAIRVVKTLQAESRPATPGEQEILARWSGWGAVSAVFEEKPGESRALTEGREQLRALLSDKEYAAARRNTINAHYTSPALAQAMWDGLAAFGFRGGRVLEPGCGAGTFIGLAPPGTAMVGIELDPVTAHITAALYPHAQIRNENFADTQMPEGSFDAVIGNVPFGSIHMTDPRYNPGRRHPIHTHFLLKSAALVRPGGWIALITSRYTLDAGDDAGDAAVEARRTLAGLGELAAAIRLPSSAHRRTAGTDVVTDVLVIRRFADGEQPPPGEPAWLQTVPVDIGGVQIPVNRYFADHPGMVLGEMTTGGARRADDLRVTVPAGTDTAGGLAQALARAAATRAVAAPRPATTPAAMDRPPEGFLQARPDGTFARITEGFFEPFDPPGGAAGRTELRALLGLRDTALALLDAELATSEDAGLVDDLRADLNARYDAYVARYGPLNRHTRQIRPSDTPAGRELRGRLLAEGLAQVTGGRVEISDPAAQEQMVAAGHATITETGELRFARTAAARAERQRLLDSGQASRHGGTVTLTDAGRDWVLENAADLGEAVTIIRQRPAQGGFRKDPFAVRVLALEKYDPETGTARKNDIMRHRVLLPRPAVEHADDPRDALAICMDRHAQVRLDVIAGLLGAASEQEARDRLGTLVFHDPAEGHLVPAPEYLSGDVRAKLRQAQEAAADDPAFQVNVEALTEVLPADLGPAEIEARLGAVFITPDEIQQFLRETLADQAVTVTLAADGTWSVKGGDRHSVAATLTWGTKDRDAMSLAEHILNRGGPVRVTRKDSEGKTWTDEEATAAARGKQAELSDRFAGWVWEDLDRAGEICRRYNDAFNSIVLRSYDDVILSLPGVNREIEPFWWQKAAIARMIYEPTAGLFHDMGAGKTLEQIIGVMEQKRLGLIRKPVICVKNHLLDQFRDEFLWAYPQARVLCADTGDLQGEGRRQFIARCASENPDAIIMTRGAFESIPLTPEGHEAYLDYMKQMFAVHAEAVADTVKEEETLLAEFEQRLRAYFDPDAQQDDDEDEEPDRKRGKRKVEQDPAVCWEQMGIDYICIDESQDYNNLWVPSDEPGMAIDFVHRSIDLEMKLHATRARYGSRVCTLATGTPVTNKIPQFYVLQRYLRPERLQKAGFAGFTPWAATYTEPEQRLEMKANGTFGMVTRMRLINVPELLLDLHYFGDFKDADDIGMKRPAIRGGKPEIRGVPAVTELLDYQATLPERYNKAKGGGKKHKGDDTVVAVLGDGFRAAQDLRLVKARHGAQPRMTDEPQKIDHIADDVYAEWLAHRDDVYPGEDGQPDPVKGSLQLVFCNEGVPKSDDWNLYEEFRNLLIERGMPRQAIRFVHEAGNDSRKKAALFAACNAGHVAVLMGSTEKMGVGTNVQARCIGVHHVHPHWRPDYDAQEDARARRHGNPNTEVFIKRWITEGSFDTIRAQACERKSVFLHVVKHRDPSVRSIEVPPDDDRESYAEVAAVGAGEPRLIQKHQLESELQQLARAQRRHINNQNALKVAEQQARTAIAAAEQTIRDIDTATGRIVPTSGDDFSMTVDGTVFTARREAGDHLISCLRAARARVPAGTCETRTAGALGGFQLTTDLAHDGREHTIVLRLENLPGGILQLDHRKLPPGIGLVTRLENKLAGLDKLRAEQHAVIDRQQQELTRAQSAIGAPFPQQDDLLAAQKALNDLIAELRDDTNRTGKTNKNSTETDTTTTTTAAAGEPSGPQHDENQDTGSDAGTDADRIADDATAAPVQPAGYPAGTGNVPGTGPAAPAPKTAEHAADPETTRPAPAGQGTARADRPDDIATQQAAGTASRHTGPGPVTRAASATSPAASDVASLPPWTAGSPHSAAITATYQAALADSNLTQAAQGNHLDRFLQVMTDWVSSYTASTTAGDSQVPPLALAVFDDPVFAADLACAVGAAVHASRTGQAPPPRGSQIPPEVTRAALSHWQEADEATARAATDQRRDIETAAQIDIWLSRAGLPRQGRQVRWDPGGHAVVELTAADGEQWRLHIPRPREAQHQATARYSLTRSGRDGWSCLLNGTPGSTTPQQAAALLTGTLEEENALLPAPAQPAASPSSAPAPAGETPPEAELAATADGGEHQDEGAEGPPVHQYTAQVDALVDAFHAADGGAAAAIRGDVQARDRQNFQVTFTTWAGRRLSAAATAAIVAAAQDSAPPPEWARAVDGDPALAADLAGAAADRVWHDLTAAADTGGAPAQRAVPGTTPASAAPAAPAAGGDADGGHPSSPGGPDKPGAGLTGEDLDFVYRHAYEYALFGVRSPGPEQEERALDYAAWYLAEFRDEQSMDDLPGHPHAWARFADQDYPARAPEKTASAQRDQDQPGTGATAEAASPPGHPQQPAATRTAAALRRLAAAHGLSAEITETGGTLTITVHDGARTILLHDDISGTMAGGRRLDPADVPAYLAAYARHPQLPPRCLADLARSGPAEPASLTLTAARETAARYALEIRIRRVSGQSYITFCEPGTAGTPILSYPAGSASAHHGPCPVPVAVIGSYLAAYRESVPAAMFTVPEPRDWGRRVAPLTPHLVDGSSLFIPAARDRLRAGLAAARSDDIAEARRLLGEAEELTPVALAPEREAELTAAIRRDTARYGHTEDPAAWLASESLRVLDASERELGWVRAYIASHPEVREHSEHSEVGEPPAGPDSDREAAVRIGLQAKAAFENGDYRRALALIDEAELRHPRLAVDWDTARAQARAAIRRADPGTPQDRQSPQAHTPATGDQTGAGTTAAAASAAPPSGPVSGTDPEENGAAPAAATPTAGADSLPGDLDAERRQPGSTAAEPAPAAPGGPDSAPARLPEGTRPLAGHTAWAGDLRPERLLYADGTPLTIRGQGEDGNQTLPATAAGTVPAPPGSDYGPGRLQVVRWDDGQYGEVHPALASPAGTDPYSGLSDRDRARWEAFDYAEALPTTTASLPPHLVDPGDVVEVERGPRSHTVDLREIRSAERGTGRYAGGFEFKIRRSKTTLYYPGNRLVPVRIPDAHPTLAAAIRAALTAGPRQPETASPAASEAAADVPDATAPAAAAAGSLAGAPGPAEADQPGRYSARIRISLESGPPTVSGTSFDDPAELREALRANFTWRKRRQIWEYTGRSLGPLEAVAAIRDVVARLDREPAAPAVKEFPPTPQQQAILDAFLDGKDIAVQALAGTGKTTTLVLLARALMDRSPEARIVYTAFNADIVADARRGRFGRNVTASTMHSLARQALLQTGYAAKIEHADKGARWPEQWAEVLGIPEIPADGTGTGPVAADAVAREVIATVRKFRESADDEPGRQHLPGHLAGRVSSPLGKTVLSYARKAWADISDAGNAGLLAAGRALRVDHDDYLKVWALSRPRINAGVIFFDEAQDVNAVMRRVILDQPAQTVVVGDSHQSIYGFRGAIDALKDWPADIVLPLTQSWRFGPAAAGFGNLFLRSLGSKLLLDGNPARDTRLGTAAEPDAILCRTNATAVAEVFAGLESGKRTALAGGGQAIREIAKAARDLQAGKGTTHPDLSRFADWDEVRHYAQQEEDGKSLQVFVRLIDRHGPGGLIDMIGRLTPEGDTRNPPQLTISTAHKVRCPRFFGQGSNRILIWKGTGSSAGQTETIHFRV
jgi:N12 class adenine-specific DNA methylase